MYGESAADSPPVTPDVRTRMNKIPRILAMLILAASLNATGGEIEVYDCSGVTFSQSIRILQEIQALLPADAIILYVDFQNAKKVSVKTATSTEPLAGRGSIFTIEKQDSQWSVTKEMKWLS